MIKSLDIEPTTICNLNCPFCFGPKIERNNSEIDFEIWKKALKKFKNMGVENIIISGGEPLLYKNIFELVEFLKNEQFNIVLSTHGRFKKKIFQIAKYCNWISLPIDGVSKEIIKIMRTDNYSNKEIIQTAKELKMKFNDVKIKIGTVATKKNIHEIIEIGKLLENNKSYFDTWKIYQYTPRRKHKNMKLEHTVSNKEFENLENLIKNNIELDSNRIVFSSNKSRKNAYTFIYHNGDVNLVNIGVHLKDLLVGNINDLKSLDINKINSQLSLNHLFNYNKTY
jgi:MoaA/NifB/PqqE/SkfB family radical SAM enzyme